MKALKCISAWTLFALITIGLVATAIVPFAATHIAWWSKFTGPISAVLGLFSCWVLFWAPPRTVGSGLRRFVQWAGYRELGVFLMIISCVMVVSTIIITAANGSQSPAVVLSWLISGLVSGASGMILLAIWVSQEFRRQIRQDLGLDTS